MRNRLVAVFSVAAVSALLLSGCAGAAESPDPTSSPSAGSCLINAQPGAASDAVEVKGSGLDAAITVPAGTEVPDIERTVVTEGDGEDVKPGDFVSARYKIVDATTNEVLETSERGPDGALPVLLSSNTGGQIYDSTQSPIFVAALECVPLGSEVVLALPGQEGQNPVVIYVQSIDELSTIATGKDVDAPKGMPAVELADDGAPTITIPGGDAPTETAVGVLKEGDGPEVSPGDLVTVQYRGVKWSDGSEFDSSWKRDAFPAQFPTTGVVAGFKAALEGQKVGSQVIVQMPPKDAYGEKSDSNTSDLAGEALVFVVDIVGTTPLITTPAQ